MWFTMGPGCPTNRHAENSFNSLHIETIPCPSAMHSQPSDSVYQTFSSARSVSLQAQPLSTRSLQHVFRRPTRSNQTGATDTASSERDDRMSPVWAIVNFLSRQEAAPFGHFLLSFRASEVADYSKDTG